MTENLDADVLQLVIARETVRAQAEILKATGLPQYFIASEMMTQAILMVIPNLNVEDARSAVQGFWETWLADYKARLAQAMADHRATAETSSLAGGVLPFRRKDDPANDLT